MKITRKPLWRGDRRKGGRLYFSCKIIQVVDREEDSISVWAQTSTARPPSTRRQEPKQTVEGS